MSRAAAIASFAVRSGLLLALSVSATAAWPAAVQPQLFSPPSNRVFEFQMTGASAEAYVSAVESLVGAFERSMGRRLAPSTRRRAALKVYAESGAGISTPLNLVRGAIQALERRGFQRSDLLIVGLSEARLRSSGFLPPLSAGGDTFDSVPVIALDSGAYYVAEWFYDSPLPARISTAFNIAEGMDADLVPTEGDRKSFLPAPLMFDVDFWINLPACTDHPVLGVNGALVNATLWNSSNTQRFFRSPATGPAAVAEMAAIPELRAGMVCTIVSLERLQFIGGPIFNSLYTRSEPLVWLSDNAVMLDSLLRVRIDNARRETGFRRLAEDLRLLAYAQQLGLGSADHSLVEWIPIQDDRVVSN